MAQLNITLDYDFFVGLFSKSKDEAFGKLMEAILNQFLHAESKEQLKAEDYERSEERTDYRNGSRERTLKTRIGKIVLEVPRHRNVPFKTTLFENYQRNEQALIATMMEMVVQGVSTRKIQKVTEELCDTGFSKSTVSEICKELDVKVKKFKERELIRPYPFVMVDAMYIKVREEYRVISKALMIAVGINEEGKKEIIGFDVSENESESTWHKFFDNLKSRGLNGTDIVISDSHTGLVKAIKESFENIAWQRCQFHFSRNILTKIPKKFQTGFAHELKEMFNSDTIEKARERENGALRKRESVIQIFPNIESAIRLMSAVLLDHNKDWLASNRYFNMQEYTDKHDEIKVKLKAA